METILAEIVSDFGVMGLIALVLYLFGQVTVKLTKWYVKVNGLEPRVDKLETTTEKLTDVICELKKMLSRLEALCEQQGKG